LRTEKRSIDLKPRSGAGFFAGVDHAARNRRCLDGACLPTEVLVFGSRGGTLRMRQIRRSLSICLGHRGEAHAIDGRSPAGQQHDRTIPLAEAVLEVVPVAQPGRQNNLNRRASVLG
jgi:hypothetical protein